MNRLLNPLLFVLFANLLCISDSLAAPTEMDKPLAVTVFVGQPMFLEGISDQTISTRLFFEGTLENPRQGLEGGEDALNERFVGFAPERIIAEECLDLMKSSKKMAFPDLAIIPQAFLVPGTAKYLDSSRNPIMDDSNPFIPVTVDDYSWKNATLDWLNSPPDAKVLELSEWKEEAYTLEVTNFRTWVSVEERYIQVMLFMRLMDHKEGKIVKKAAYIKGTESLPRRLAWTDPKIFIPIYRECVREAAEKGLKKLKMY